MKKTFFPIKNKYKIAGSTIKYLCSFLVPGIIACFTTCIPGYGQTTKLITVKANEIRGTVEPTMWGVFFEDINLGADGGIYAELVKNRSFEFSKPLMGWRIEQNPFNEGAVTILNVSVYLF